MAGVHATDAPLLVFMDGDGSDISADIPALLAALSAGADLSLGVRGGDAVEAGAITLPAQFGNAVAGVLLSALYGRRLHDLSPLKAIRRDLITRIEPRELTYGWTVEVLGHALELHATIAEVVDRWVRQFPVESQAAILSEAVDRSSNEFLPTHSVCEHRTVMPMTARTKQRLLVYVGR